MTDQNEQEMPFAHSMREIFQRLGDKTETEYPGSYTNDREKLASNFLRNIRARIADLEAKLKTRLFLSEVQITKTDILDILEEEARYPIGNFSNSPAAIAGLEAILKDNIVTEEEARKLICLSLQAVIDSAPKALDRERSMGNQAKVQEIENDLKEIKKTMAFVQERATPTGITGPAAS